MRRINLWVFVMLTLAAGTMRGAWARPDIRFGTAAEFQAPITAGQLTGVAPTVVYTNTVPYNGLVSANPAAALNVRTSAAYQYKWPTDPDLTFAALILELYLPQVAPTVGGAGIDTVEITIFDEPTHTFRRWGFDPTRLTLGLNTFTFGFSEGAGAGGSTSFVSTLADLTSIDVLEVRALGTRTPTFPPPPPSDGPTPAPTDALWSVTTHLEVVTVPEPGTLLLFPLGAAGWILVRRRCLSPAPAR